MAPSLSETNIEAQVGNVSGGSQVAVGSYILQINSLQGGVVNFAPEGQAVPRPRPQPVLLRPRAFTGLLDRVSETDSVVQALQSKESVECSGDPGAGKTSLLRHLSYHPRAEAFPSGVVYFQVNRQSPADLLKALFDAFYEYDSPLKPTETQIRHYLQDVSALILLDDVEAAREQSEYLMNVAPNCTFITASTERSLFGEAREVVLKGLPGGEALVLFEREFGRALSGEERSAAQALCESLGCYPLRVLRAARQAREEGLPEFAGPAPNTPVMTAAQMPAPDVVRPRSEDEEKVLAVLVFFHGAPVRAEHVAEVAEVQSAPRVLEELVERGLVQSHEGRYSIAGDIGGTLRRERETTPWLERALAHFTDWAERNYREPKLVAAAAQSILLVLEQGVAAERWSEVRRLGHAAEEALALSGKWDAWAATLQCVLRAARAQEYLAEEAWALHQLGTRALCLEERPAALTFLNEALAMRKSLNDQGGAAVTRHNLNILLSPPPPDKSHTKPDPSPLPLLLKLVVPALLLMACGATIAYRFWPPKPPVKPVRIMTFSASPETVPADARAQLCYEVLDASSARIEPDVGERKPAAKECLTVTPQRTTVYTLTATGLDGRTVSSQVTVNVEAPPPPVPPAAEILGFAVQRRNGPGGASDVQFQLCYGVRNADRVEIDNGVGVVAAVEQQCVPVRPSQTTTYTMTATNSDGRSVQRQVTVDATKPPPPPTQILSFDTSPARIVAGETAQLCYRLSGASSAHIDPGSRDVSVGPDMQCVNVAPKEPTAYTLTALNPEGKPVSKRTTVAVTPPAPKVVVFAADPNPIVAGGRVRLCYETTDAIRVEINGVGPVRPAEEGCAEADVPFPSKTFTLTATGRDGRTASQSVTVTATLPPPEISFSADPESIQAGQTVLLCYSVANVKSFGIALSGRRLRPLTEPKTCIPVRPTATTTYTLTATGLGGQTVSAQATVNVTPAPLKHARIIFFNASEPSIKSGESLSLCYGVSDAVRVVITPLAGRRGLPTSGLPPSEKNCVSAFPKQTQTFTLTAVGEDRQPETSQVTVEVVSESRPDNNNSDSGQEQQPSARITRLEIKRRKLGAMQLCYAVENARDARVEPDFGDVKLPGDCMNIRATEPRTYTLTATGLDGQTVSGSVEYTPPRPLPISIVSFSPASQTIDRGNQARICYSTLGEGTAQISPQVGEVPPAGWPLKKCVTVTPTETTVYTLTVTGPEGQKGSKQVTVNVRQPVIQ